MMNFALFETAIGCCGIVWSERGVTGVQLPERGEAATRKRLLRRFPGAREGAPSAEVRRAIGDIVALLGGERRDLNHVTIDIRHAVGVPSTRLRGCATHPRRRDAFLW